MISFCLWVFYLGVISYSPTWKCILWKTSRYLHATSHRRCSVKKGVLKSFPNFIGKHLWCSLYLIKLPACNFIKKRLQHKCFPVNFGKLLKTPVLKNIRERLLVVKWVDEDFQPREAFIVLKPVTRCNAEQITNSLKWLS